MQVARAAVKANRYDPQECLQTFKGKTFTCLSLSLPHSEQCSFCRSGGVKRTIIETEQAMEEMEPDLHFQNREPETWVADEIMKAMEL